MKAIVRHTYGSPDVLKLAEVQTPSPKDDEVLIKVQASSVNAADWRMLRADPFLARLDVGLLKPRNKILGVDVAGVVKAAGRAVTQFRVGDEVFGNIFDLRGGAFAEYVAVPERLLVRKPANLTFQQAAAVPLAAVTARAACVTMGRSSRGSGCSSTALRAASALSQCRLPRRWALTSRQWSAPGTWTWRVRSARITSLITRGRTRWPGVKHAMT
jgi:NADPH:quinone reductase-like Zn-dependent oxidoreductase